MILFTSADRKINRRRVIALTLVLIFLMAGVVGLYNHHRPAPAGIGRAGPVHYLTDREVEFLYDLTYTQDDRRIAEQQIFEEIFSLIDEAEEFILLDFFLFNKVDGPPERFIDLTGDLTDRLIAKQNQRPEMEIYLVTDPINNFYGSYQAEHLSRLEAAGVAVILSDLTQLRDSNPLYSGFWRSYIQWFGTAGPGWLPHPFGGRKPRVTLRSVLAAINFKANHRKILIADSRDRMVSIVTSANPHNASSFHSNIAFKVTGPIWRDIWSSEQAVPKLAGTRIKPPTRPTQERAQFKDQPITVQMLTESRIRDRLLADLEAVETDGSVEIAMFYLSDRRVITALLAAAERGVDIRIILDPNQDAFGRQKIGIPNRPVAYELSDRSDGSIKIRWFDTRGEQFHSKLTVIRNPTEVIIHGGSANLTKRNLGDFNLETNLRLTASPDTILAQAVRDYFDRLWYNRSGQYTLDLKDTYYETSRVKYWLYRFQEWSGSSSF